MQLYMSWFIRSFFGFTFLNILNFFKYSCTNIFHRRSLRSLYTFYYECILFAATHKMTWYNVHSSVHGNTIIHDNTIIHYYQPRWIYILLLLKFGTVGILDQLLCLTYSAGLHWIETWREALFALNSADLHQNSTDIPTAIYLYYNTLHYIWILAKPIGLLIPLAHHPLFNSCPRT